MSVSLSGTIERREMGTGAWALVADDGQTYEIYEGAPSDLLKPGQKVKVNGRIRDDVMTLAAIGPVLQVDGFELN
ncbi:hypothetical protein JJD41_17890 [Oxynema sp. CENA135]|uniref:hypothetical protein n=1 Tax=Oxynema sp. CENA135 TaxID=984206 RepID=UPI00190DA7CE|nr:hypothetical protein [Oxynema sp. CENA135]MBK4731723.1 hypothetical protein [Oxynema sp. CENA135]